MTKDANKSQDLITGDDASSIDAITLGAGRFLRAVLIPALVECGFKPAIFQTRGRSFLEHCRPRHLTYEIDTVEYDGSITTNEVACYGVGSLGSASGKAAVLDLLERMTLIRVIGVGVTEAGINPHSPSLADLTDILHKASLLLKSGSLVCPNRNNRICIINTDNVPRNGDAIKEHVTRRGKETYGEEFCRFLEDRVVFHNSMVDRITSHREGDGMVPRCEPVPKKALVVEDLGRDLPEVLLTDEATTRDRFGVVIRCGEGDLRRDIALKLRVANGTHTALAHCCSLSSYLMTDVLSLGDDDGGVLLMDYLDSFFYDQILSGAEKEFGREETVKVYEDWRKRLRHPHFGLSTFFITQNGAAKGGIRIAPTIRCLIQQDKEVSVATAFALAAILRFLTPLKQSESGDNNKYRGWLDDATKWGLSSSAPGELSKVYADGLEYNLEEKWYEFKCDCMISNDKALPVRLTELGVGQPELYHEVVLEYLTCSSGGNMRDLHESSQTSAKFNELVRSICTLLARMISNDGVLNILSEMKEKKGVFEDGFSTPCKVLVDGVGPCSAMPLNYHLSPIPDGSNLLKAKVDMCTLPSVVASEMSSVQVIDLHTHLLPPSHGSLCLWGIDEILTYHYLVAEYFITAPPSMTPELFYSKSKKDQADIIWDALFLKRSPISEACRGVITTLQSLGLSDAVRKRDLGKIRDFYRVWRDKGPSGVDAFSEKVFESSGVKYAIMTNIPFDVTEAQHWRPAKKDYSRRYRSALRVDPLLSGDVKTIQNALQASGYPLTLEGARQYLRDWCDTIKPEYMMASTPHNFTLKDSGPLSNVKKTGVNEEAMKQPFAFVDALSNQDQCNEDTDEAPTIINENSDYFAQVLMQVCMERDLPLALKIGAHRGVNPALQAAGDGLAYVNPSILSRLCTQYPKVRFLVTFLSRTTQHEACVLASKFRNLHLYGCWWFCNSPSIIADITKMRLEMLGTAFTAQHSDARVLEQLIYKWAHSRRVISQAMQRQFSNIIVVGWELTRGEIRRDIWKLFGGTYEEFMKKSLL